MLLSLAAYLASIVTLYLIGFRIAELRGTLSREDSAALKQEMLGFAEVLYRTTSLNTDKAKTLAETYNELDTFLILGSGPSYATALVAAAKLFELPQLNGVGFGAPPKTPPPRAGSRSALAAPWVHAHEAWCLLDCRIPWPQL